MNIKLNWKVICTATAFVIVVAVLSIKSDGQWIGFWGNVVGGLIGGIITLVGINLTLANEKTKARQALFRPYKVYDDEISMLIFQLHLVAGMSEVDYTPGKYQMLREKLQEIKKEFDGLKEYDDNLKAALPSIYNAFVATRDLIDDIFQHSFYLTKTEVPVEEFVKDIIFSANLIQDKRDRILQLIEELV